MDDPYVMPYILEWRFWVHNGTFWMNFWFYRYLFATNLAWSYMGLKIFIETNKNAYISNFARFLLCNALVWFSKSQKIFFCVKNRNSHNQFRGIRSQYVEWILNKIDNSFIEAFTDWGNMHQRFRIYFAWTWILNHRIQN